MDIVHSEPTVDHLLPYCVLKLLCRKTRTIMFCSVKAWLSRHSYLMVYSELIIQLRPGEGSWSWFSGRLLNFD